MSKFEVEIAEKKIFGIAGKIIKNGSVEKIYRVCERWGEDAEQVREYDVYKIIFKSRTLILKKAMQREINNYEHYLSKHTDFCVPKYYGKYKNGSDLWIMIENVEGDDVRNMTDTLAKAAAESISKIQSAFWEDSDCERFEIYMNRINKRFEYIKMEPIIGPAYKIFAERQKHCPRTLSNGDFLEFNAVNNNGMVFIIDWGFGGIMPYSLDIARFIAHATKDRATFPFYMTDNQKQIFLDKVYESLEQKISKEQFDFDIRLAVLNEYVEFIEAGEDDNQWYYEHAKKLAQEILDYKG